jgi:hypothetical protein
MSKSATAFRSCGQSENVRTQFNALLADQLTMVGGTYPRTSAGLVIGTTKPRVGTVAFTYQIGGLGYAKAAVAAGTAFTDTTHDIADGKENTFLLSIATGGTITITMGTVGTGEGNAGAIAALPTGECAIGLVTIYAEGAAFNANTNDLDATHLTVTYKSYTYDDAFSGGRTAAALTEY